MYLHLILKENRMEMFSVNFVLTKSNRISKKIKREVNKKHGKKTIGPGAEKSVEGSG